MIDLCILSESVWPSCSGGISTWIQHLLSALPAATVEVINLSINLPSVGHFPTDSVHKIYDGMPSEGIPSAAAYICCGITTAEKILNDRPDLASKIIYVEHGDAVQEAQLGLAITEGGRPVSVSDLKTHVLDVQNRRAEIVQRVGKVVCVTQKATLRIQAERNAPSYYIPNAVPPPTNNTNLQQVPGVIGFVGRLAKVKGIDRLAQLAAHLSLPIIGVGLPTLDSVDTEIANASKNGVQWHIAPEDPWTHPFAAIVMPSRLEGCPFVALEAEAQGISVLLSDVADIPPSVLIQQQPWQVSSWAQQTRKLLARGRQPQLGAQLAHNRWQSFMKHWQQVTQE